MANKWTDAQKNAINSRGGSLLVSAAAGSGKTAVLVERIVQRITDKQNPCDIDELLIVTFAKDAAAEMRERIYSRLREMLEQNPDDTSLVRQQLILPRAKICTIDSFFGDVVRENASLLGVSADYKIVTGTQHEDYMARAIKRALEDMYERMPEGFSELVELVSQGRDDSALEKTVLSIYNGINAYPFPRKRLDCLLDMYADTADARSTPWGKVIFSHCKNALRYNIYKYDNLLSQMREEPELFSAYYTFVLDERNKIETLISNLDKMCWDEAVSALNDFEFDKLPSAKGISTHPVKKLTTAVRKECKDAFGKLCSDFMFVSNEEFECDRQKCLPIVSALVEAVWVFIEKLREIMNNDNVLGFNDIQHLTVKALCEFDGDGVKRTNIAKEMSERFEEIFIDEYQDVNAVQHMIFSAVSKDDNNIFMVGDVKQSIYAFRQAMPKIFLGMRNEFSPYDSVNYPAKIILDRNFRSGNSVIDTVNFCFRMLMSQEVGGIAYDGEDELVVGAEYKTDKCSEFDIVTVSKGENSDFVQASFIADRIESIVKSGQHITLKDRTTRPVRYGDFCILLRSAKSHASNYVRVLKSKNINVVYELSGDFFDCEEIRIMLSLLRVVDNPLLDVELLSVMFSPLYGFSPDDMAKIRMAKKNVPLYSAVSHCAQNGEERCKRFIDDIDRYRLLASTVTSDELIRRVYDDTSFVALCRAMGCGEQRYANLMLLINYAQDFESNGFRGLSAFVRFMERLEQGESTVSSSLDSSAVDNAVRIMTIHKSKGLEFPYCIIAGLGTKFNRQPVNLGMITHSELGIGFDLRDVDTLCEYSTVQRAAVRQAIINDEMAEQLRVLYVAMTRAKEKLIMVTATTNSEKLIEKCSGADCAEKLDSFTICNATNQTELILPCLLAHPVAKNVGVFNSAFDMDNEIDGSDVPFSVNIIGSNETEYEPESEQENIDIAFASSELENEIMERLSYKYPYMPLSKTVSKTTASNLKEHAFNEEFFASDIPAFMSKSGMTAAQRGTAAHRFLQCCDFSCCDDLKAEASRLVGDGKLTQEQMDAIDFNLLKSFFDSDLFSRIMKSDNVQREYNFAVNMSACDIDGELSKQFEDELVMVQGAVDCFFEENGEIVIVDYKTDRVGDEAQLRDRYSTQLELYRAAIEQSTEKIVKQCVLYSVTLGKTVEI